MDTSRRCTTSTQYVPLNKARDEFRLLKLHSRERNRRRPPDVKFKYYDISPKIQCTFQNSLLSQKPDYDALSYRWGEGEQNDRRILLNDEIVEIGQNLYEFLCRLQRTHRSRTLWVDALCINQRNIKERNHQVQMMGRIYRGANAVLVWLGRELQNSFQVIDLSKKMQEYAESADTDFRRPQATSNFNVLDYFEGLNRLCYRQYWTRTWIIQEIVLAKKISLFCGADQISWNTFITSLLRATRGDDKVLHLFFPEMYYYQSNEDGFLLETSAISKYQS